MYHQLAVTEKSLRRAIFGTPARRYGGTGLGPGMKSTHLADIVFNGDRVGLFEYERPFDVVSACQRFFQPTNMAREDPGLNSSSRPA